MRTEFQNAIRVNHRGFLNCGAKRFVLMDNPVGDRTFTVFSIRNVENIPVYTAMLEPDLLPDGSRCWTGDFSAVTEDGDYFIQAGGYHSRQFVIYPKAYDICLRMMLEYFTWQRCGHELGWNGKCHADDGYIRETGQRVDLSGGYHQSCDLRKSPGGLSLGVLAMLRFVRKDRSAWGRILAFDEAAWACDYFVKTIQENGAMYNTLNEPFGWGPRVFYQSPAPSSAQWNTTSLLAQGSILFRQRDPERAAAYLAVARRSWDFMTGPRRPEGVYRHPEPAPRGMDPDHFFLQCCKGSSADLAYQVQAACDLYRATGEEAFLLPLRAGVQTLTDGMQEGELAHLLMQNDGSGRSVMAGGIYSWMPGGLIALCDAYELLGDECDLARRIRSAAEALVRQAGTNVWRSLKPLLTQADLDQPVGHAAPGAPAPTLRQLAGALEPYGEQESALPCYRRTSPSVIVSSLSCFGIFLARAARLLQEPRWLDTAQACLDQLLGTNPLDSSHIRAIGYNHAQHKAYGQFFPSTPFLPGAAGTAYDTIDVYQSHSEYDMPCVGLAMYLMSELSDPS